MPSGPVSIFYYSMYGMGVVAMSSENVVMVSRGKTEVGVNREITHTKAVKLENKNNKALFYPVVQ